MNNPVSLMVLSVSRGVRLRRMIIVAVLLVIGLGGAALYLVHAHRLETQRQAEVGLAEARARAIARAKAAARAKAEAAATAAPLVAESRVARSKQAEEMFAPHSWYVAPPPPPPAAEEAPAAPTAPPLPYAYVGSYTPAGERATYFLARGDRVIDAHVGDKLDGVLLFEKVDGGQLVFNYLPLNIRQTLPAGVVQ
jgi:hypothetical protein